MKLKKDIGRDFPVQNAEVIEASRKYLKTKTTSQIAIGIMVCSALLLLGAALLGLLIGDFSGLQNLWSVIALPTGVVITHYFESGRRDEQEND